MPANLGGPTRSYPVNLALGGRTRSYPVNLCGHTKFKPVKLGGRSQPFRAHKILASQPGWTHNILPSQPGRTHKILASQPGPPVNLPNTGRLQLTEAGKIRRMIKTTLSHNQGRAQKLTLRSGLAQAESQAKETSKMFCKVVGLSSARSVGNTLGEVVGSSAVTN